MFIGSQTYKHLRIKSTYHIIFLEVVVFKRITHTHQFQSKWMAYRQLKMSIGSAPQAGGGWEWQEGVHVSIRGHHSRTDSLIAGLSLHLRKQLCVWTVRTRVLGRRKWLESKDSNTWFEFHRSREKDVKCWLDTQQFIRKAFRRNNERDKWTSLVKDQLSQGAKRMPGQWDKRHASSSWMSLIKCPFVYTERF